MFDVTNEGAFAIDAESASETTSLDDIPDLIASDDEDDGPSMIPVSLIPQRYELPKSQSAVKGLKRGFLNPVEGPSTPSRRILSCTLADTVGRDEGPSAVVSTLGDCEAKAMGVGVDARPEVPSQDPVVLPHITEHFRAWASEREALRRKKGLCAGEDGNGDAYVGRCCLRPGGYNSLVCVKEGEGSALRASERRISIKCSAGCVLLYHWPDCWNRFIEEYKSNSGEDFNANCKASARSGTGRLVPCITEGCEGWVKLAVVLQGPPGVETDRKVRYEMTEEQEEEVERLVRLKKEKEKAAKLAKRLAEIAANNKFPANPNKVRRQRRPRPQPSQSAFMNHNGIHEGRGSLSAHHQDAMRRPGHVGDALVLAAANPSQAGAASPLVLPQDMQLRLLQRSDGSDDEQKEVRAGREKKVEAVQYKAATSGDPKGRRKKKKGVRLKLDGAGPEEDGEEYAWARGEGLLDELHREHPVRAPAVQLRMAEFPTLAQAAQQQAQEPDADRSRMKLDVTMDALNAMKFGATEAHVTNHVLVECVDMVMLAHQGEDVEEMFRTLFSAHGAILQFRKFVDQECVAVSMDSVAHAFQAVSLLQDVFVQRKRIKLCFLRDFPSDEKLALFDPDYPCHSSPTPNLPPNTFTHQVSSELQDQLAAQVLRCEISEEELLSQLEAQERHLQHDFYEDGAYLRDGWALHPAAVGWQSYHTRQLMQYEEDPDRLSQTSSFLLKGLDEEYAPGDSYPMVDDGGDYEMYAYQDEDERLPEWAESNDYYWSYEPVQQPGLEAPTSRRIRTMSEKSTISTGHRQLNPAAAEFRPSSFTSTGSPSASSAPPSEGLVHAPMSRLAKVTHQDAPEDLKEEFGLGSHVQEGIPEEEHEEKEEQPLDSADFVDCEEVPRTPPEDSKPEETSEITLTDGDKGTLLATSTSQSDPHGLPEDLMFQVVLVLATKTDYLTSVYRKSSRFRLAHQWFVAAIDPEDIWHKQRTALVLFNIDTHCLEGLWGAIANQDKAIEWSEAARYLGVPKDICADVVVLPQRVMPIRLEGATALTLILRLDEYCRTQQEQRTALLEEAQEDLLVEDKGYRNVEAPQPPGGPFLDVGGSAGVQQGTSDVHDEASSIPSEDAPGQPQHGGRSVGPGPNRAEGSPVPAVQEAKAGSRTPVEQAGNEPSGGQGMGQTGDVAVADGLTSRAPTLHMAPPRPPPPLYNPLIALQQGRVHSNARPAAVPAVGPFSGPNLQGSPGPRDVASTHTGAQTCSSQASPAPPRAVGPPGARPMDQRLFAAFPFLMAAEKQGPAATARPPVADSSPFIQQTSNAISPADPVEPPRHAASSLAAVLPSQPAYMYASTNPALTNIDNGHDSGVWEVMPPGATWQWGRKVDGQPIGETGGSLWAGRPPVTSTEFQSVQLGGIGTGPPVVSKELAAARTSKRLCPLCGLHPSGYVHLGCKHLGPCPTCLPDRGLFGGNYPACVQCGMAVGSASVLFRVRQ